MKQLGSWHCVHCTQLRQLIPRFGGRTRTQMVAHRHGYQSGLTQLHEMGEIGRG